MAWIEAHATVDRGQVEPVSTLLFELGCQGLQEDDGSAPQQIWEKDLPPPSGPVILRAYFDSPDRAAVDAAVLELGVSLEWIAVPETDWSQSWKQGFKPLHISERLVIAPPWDAPEGAVVIEPGQGFGTGAHPTTRLMLEALDALADEADLQTMLDIGCGSGILTLAAARLGLRARGVDVDPNALEEARENAKRNGLVVQFASTPIARLNEPADLVLANLHAEIMIPMAPDLVRLSKRRLLVCGVLADREERVRSAFPTLTLAAREASGEWVQLSYTV